MHEYFFLVKPKSISISNHSRFYNIVHLADTNSSELGYWLFTPVKVLFDIL